MSSARRGNIDNFRQQAFADTRPISQFGRKNRLEFAIRRHSPTFDIAMVAIIVGAVLFNLTIGSLTPLLIIGVIGMFLIIRWENALTLGAACWPLLLLPAFALLSALWSEVPFTTIRYSLIYLITVRAGMILGGGLQRSSFIIGNFIAFAFYFVMSLAFGRFVNWGDGPGDAFAGLAGSKNSYGDMAGLAILSATAFVIWAWANRKRVLAGSAALLVPLMFGSLILSRATSALIATLAALACLLLWAASRRLALQARSGIFIAALAVAAILLTTQNFWLPPLFEFVVEASGKNMGLTGRVDLWRFGNGLIGERPWLGLGYNAFWLQDSLDAQYLWNMMGIASRQGFSFHNTSMEIVVHLGYVGLALFGLIAAIGIVTLIMRTMAVPYISSIYACALVIFFALKLPFEVVGFGTMHFSTIFGFAILAMGFRRPMVLETTASPR